MFQARHTRGAVGLVPTPCYRAPMPLEPLSAFSAARKLNSIRKKASEHSEQINLLKSFEVQTNEHNLFMLEIFLGALDLHAEERGATKWRTKLLDDDLPSSERFEVAAGLRESFLHLLRSSHDPVLGNEMLATVAAGLSGLGYSEDIKARVLRIAPQLIPEDIDLLYRFCTEGVGYTEINERQEIKWFTRFLIQESWELRFAQDDGGVSEKIDSWSFDSLVRHQLIARYPLVEPGGGRPKYLPGGVPPEEHPPFRLQWRLNLFGKVIMEAFAGKSIDDIAPRPRNAEEVGSGNDGGDEALGGEHGSGKLES